MFSKKLSAFLALFVLSFILSSTPAHARLLFQDDLFHELPSEGLNLNADDIGDEDVTLKFGNDGTDGEIIFDDGTGDVTLQTPGGDFFFSDDHLSGTGGLNFDGNVDFSNALQIRLREVADESAAECTTVNEVVLDTTENVLYVCTVADDPGTWASLSGVAAQDFEEVYATDGDNTLTATGTFDIDAVGVVGIDSDTNVSLSGAGVGITSDGGALGLMGDGTNDIDIGNAGGTIDLDAASYLLDVTGAFSLDSAASSNISLSANAAGDQTLSISATNAGAGNGFLAFASDVWNITAQGALTGVTQLVVDNLTFDGALITSDTGTIGLDNENLTTTGAVTAGDFQIGTTTLTETTAANDSGAFLVGTFDEFDQSDSTNVQDVLDDLDTALTDQTALKVEQLHFEPEYPNVVIFQDGSDNKGKLEADYDSTNTENYYRWTTEQTAAANDIDLRTRYQLPDDFGIAGDLTLDLRTFTTLTGDNSVSVTVKNDTDDTTCHADAATASTVANTWETLTISAAELGTGCSGGSVLSAGDVIEIQIKLAADNTNTGVVDVGTLHLNYTK